MDVGNKTLAQLSEEAKEKKYVTIETGSKISGYTKDYLERLCRLNKVEYRMWNNGQFVIELESLLTETHTILLSYEDVTFVDKAELTDPFPQIVGNVLSAVLRDAGKGEDDLSKRSQELMSAKVADGTAQEVPTFGDANRAPSQQLPSAFSFVGRAVVSDPLHPENTKETEVHVPISANQLTEAASGVPVVTDAPKSVATPAPVVAARVSPEPKSAPHIATHLTISRDGQPAPQASTNASHAPTHLKISSDAKTVVIPPLAPSIAEEAELLRKSAIHLNVTREKGESEPKASATPAPVSEKKPDAWDKALLQPALATATPSPYRPIVTSIDASDHHEDAPLFPTPSKEPIAKVVTPNVTPAPVTPAPVVATVVAPTPPVVAPTTVTPQMAIKVTPPAPPTTPTPSETKPLVHPLASASEYHPGIPDLGENKRVTVFMPTPANETGKTVAPASGIASSPLESTSIDKHAPTSAIPTKPKPPMSRASLAPALRVSPQMDVASSQLPMVKEGHDLEVRHDFPLVKSASFNLVFALFLFAGIGMLLAAGTLPSFNSASYVAGVGAADQRGEGATATTPAPMVNRDEHGVVLPFSDEIATTTGSVPGSLIIRPVFKGTKGPAYEYTVEGGE